ncbi:MAG TPA: 16S rRNA (guanine(527)-N(7))-methyltransferase RsmG [Clostridiales bacterium]|nr:16S rRNA (guanine(527)-N(7))-methyltransferase RsmG [Clostridiales bacterium]
MEKLKRFLEQKGLPADTHAIGRYQLYMEEVLRRNETINLTAIRVPEEFEEKHLIDSLSILDFPGFEQAGRVLDIGTGAGLPGIPLAITAPDKTFLLMDSVGKKLTAVSEIALALGLNNVQVLHARAEDPASDPAYRETFDLVVSRAVANLSTLSEYCLPYVREGGWFVAYKTLSAKEEIRQAQRAIRLLGGAPAQTLQGDVPESGHILVCIEKVRRTPPAYPRKAGTPAKDPL